MPPNGPKAKEMLCAAELSHRSLIDIRQLSHCLIDIRHASPVECVPIVSPACTHASFMHSFICLLYNGLSLCV